MIKEFDKEENCGCKDEGCGCEEHDHDCGCGEHDHDCGCGEHDHDCGCGIDEEPHMISLLLDDGSEEECMVIGEFPAGDHDYIALLNQEDDVYIYRFAIVEEDGEEVLDLVNIETDEEFKLVEDAFYDYFEEVEEDEEEEEVKE